MIQCENLLVLSPCPQISLTSSLLEDPSLPLTVLLSGKISPSFPSYQHLLEQQKCFCFWTETECIIFAISSIVQAPFYNASQHTWFPRCAKGDLWWFPEPCSHAQLTVEDPGGRSPCTASFRAAPEGCCGGCPCQHPDAAAAAACVGAGQQQHGPTITPAAARQVTPREITWPEFGVAYSIVPLHRAFR